jgi:hypothetical protein
MIMEWLNFVCWNNSLNPPIFETWKANHTFQVASNQSSIFYVICDYWCWAWKTNKVVFSMLDKEGLDMIIVFVKLFGVPSNSIQ